MSMWRSIIKNRLVLKTLFGVHLEYMSKVKVERNFKISYIPQDTSNLTENWNQYSKEHGVEEYTEDN